MIRTLKFDLRYDPANSKNIGCHAVDSLNHEEVQCVRETRQRVRYGGERGQRTLRMNRGP